MHCEVGQLRQAFVHRSGLELSPDRDGGADHPDGAEILARELLRSAQATTVIACGSPSRRRTAFSRRNSTLSDPALVKN